MNPNGVAVDNLGNVYVADTDNHRIQLFGLGWPTGTVTIQKELRDPSGALIPSMDLSGYAFSLITQGGGPSIPLGVTSKAGRVTMGVAAGSYVLGEQLPPGAPPPTFLIGATPVVGFTIATGQTVVITARNVVAGSAAIARQAMVFDATGNATMPPAGLTGSAFALTGPGGLSSSVTSDATGRATLRNLAAGTYAVTAQPRAGFDLVAVIPAGGTDVGNGGSITVPAGATLAITVQHRLSPQAAEVVSLAPGCNNVTLTWASGTAARTVADAIAPGPILVAIWRYDSTTRRFVGYSPIPNAPNDLTMVDRLDAVYLCVTTAGTLSPPAV